MRTIEKIYRDLSPGILIKEGDKVLLEDYYPTPKTIIKALITLLDVNI